MSPSSGYDPYIQPLTLPICGLYNISMQITEAGVSAVQETLHMYRRLMFTLSGTIRNASRNFHVMVGLSSLQYVEDFHITSGIVFSSTQTPHRCCLNSTNTQPLLTNENGQSELTYLQLT
jgi:hypothetical protein